MRGRPVRGAAGRPAAPGDRGRAVAPGRPAPVTPTDRGTGSPAGGHPAAGPPTGLPQTAYPPVENVAPGSDGRDPAAPAPHRRARWRARLAGAALVALVVTVLAHAVAVHGDRDAAVQERAAAVAAESDAGAARAAVQARLDELAARFGGTRARLAEVRATAEAHREERGRVDDANGTAQVQRDALAAADYASGLAAMADADRANLLGACLGALDAAQSLLIAGGPQAATGALRAGSESCRRAGPLADGPGPPADSAYDFADPFVLVDGDRSVAVATNGPGGTVQALTARGGDGWTVAGDALAGLPMWAEPGRTWAPAVSRVGPAYVLYYSARERSSGRQCISVATADRAEGPYADTSWGPLICQRDQGGSIDPSPVVAPDGGRYLLWKSDGNAAGEGTRLWGQRLTPDGRNLVDGAVQLLSADQRWEGGVVEAPSMAFVGGQWLLLYAGNRWETADYATGEARCDGPLGPCRKLADPVVLRSGAGLAGPGGAEFFRDTGGGLHVVFHAWSSGAVGGGRSRRMYVRTVAVAGDGRVVVSG
jgi:hypothetical protein